MKKDKLYLINTIFRSENIRSVWNEEEEKYYISVVDVVTILSESSDGRKYWNKLKQRLREEGNELVSNCHQLKLKATDGKYYLTDVVDIEEMFRIIESIPSKNAEPIKQWLAGLGSERINELFDPSIPVQRAIDLYRSKGYDETWISKRIKSLQDRKGLTDVWKDNGINNQFEYAILTNEIYKTWSGMTSNEYKQYKGLRKESLRDNMDSIELILTDLSEEATKIIAEKKKLKGLDENINIARMGGNAAKLAKEDIKKNLGESILKKDNKISYKHIKDDNSNIKNIGGKNE